jgi:hypothetical protein
VACGSVDWNRPEETSATVPKGLHFEKMVSSAL